MEPAEQTALTRTERELLLDLTQLALDVMGLLEPTPFADAANALISLGRGDYSGAALSALGVIPYVGDVAKAGRLGKYRRTVERAIQLARERPDLAESVRVALRRVAGAIDGALAHRLPKQLRQELVSMRTAIAGFMAQG